MGEYMRIDTARPLSAERRDEINRQAVPLLEATCESPIEQQMLAALCVVITGRPNTMLTIMDRDEVFPEDDDELGITGTSEQAVWIYPQCRIGSYRADFVVVWTRDPARVHHVVVECDGFEFHGQNKAQFVRDRVRDRIMRYVGLTVLRFSGSEIYADRSQCAHNVFEYLESRDRLEVR